MLVPLSWLKEYVDITLPLEEVRAKLSASGSAVERVYHIGQGLGDLIVAKAVEVAKHPNADRLKVAQVDTGSEVVEVVCGAPNLQAGQHIVFARPGARVPVDMHDPERHPFVLQEATIRGVVSHGMICSAAEMGLGEDHGGILVLPESTKLGQPVTEALGYPQIVLDIEVTTNRADELSMIGLAREISVLTGKTLKDPSNQRPLHPSQEQRSQTTNNLIVQIDSSACFRLMAQALRVTVGPSPWWMQQYLSLAGMRPINNVVDITNFVMLEYGQPMHAYDRSRVTGSMLVARHATEGEMMVTLDGITRQLKSSMLVIADAKEPVGIAGIMGGQASMIDISSTEIVLEAAVFEAVSIRRTANALALRSEASKRFERQVDAAMTPIALQRAVDLLVEYAGAEVMGAAQDAYKTQPEEKHYILSQQKLNQYMGKEFALADAASILQALGFKKTASEPSDSTMSFQVPSWRVRDIEGEEDLIEEVVRIVGYDQLPVALPSGTVPNRPLNQSYQATIATKELLARMDWTEVITLSLTSIEAQQRAGIASPTVALANPLSSEWTHMRSSLLPGLLDVARRNRHTELRVFELSSVYDQQQGLPLQQLRLGLLWATKWPIEASVASLKGSVEAVLANLTSIQTLTFTASEQPPAPFAPSGAAVIELDGAHIGWIGGVVPEVEKAFDLPEGTLLADIAIEPFLQRPQPKQFQPLPQYPSIEEDLSLVMDEQAPVSEAINAIIQGGGALVEKVDLTSIYRDKSLGQGKKSPLLHITFRAKDHSLASSELDATRGSIQTSLQVIGVGVRA